QRLVWRSCSTVDDPQCLDFIDRIAVPLTGQRRGRIRTKLLGALQGKRRNVRPMRELRLLREIRWCRLVISRGVSENIRNGLSIGSVIVSQSQDLVRNRLSYADSLRLIRSLWNLCQRLLELSIKQCLKVWIQLDEDFVCGCSGRRIL